MTEIIEQIKQIIESGEINRMQLAKEIGVTPPVISSYLNGKYTGDNDKITQSLEGWLEQREIKRSQFMTAPEFIQTPTAELIHTIISYAHALGCITTVFGMSGAGKTVAAGNIKNATVTYGWLPLAQAVLALRKCCTKSLLL